MTTVATRQRKDSTAAGAAQQSAATGATGETLHLALELDDQGWKLGFTTGLGQQPRERRIRPRNTEQLLREIGGAKVRFRLPKAAKVVSCYEAGREGFWLHRFLEAHGVENRIVDSSSIEVKRRARHVKADRPDLRRLLRMLVRHESGEKKVWSVVNVPSLEEEDARHLHRELSTLRSDRTRATNRIKGLGASQGLRIEVNQNLMSDLEGLRLWNGSPVPEGLKRRMAGAFVQLQSTQAAIKELEEERDAILEQSKDPAIDKVRRLIQLRAIGINSAWIFVMEFFAWRSFRNRRQVGALAGLTPTPYQSGATAREQGISKSGNRHVRAILIQIAWAWLRYQPESALSRWYHERFGHGSKRMRKIGIVALSRRLLIEIWRYLETGTPPEGALLKP